MAIHKRPDGKGYTAYFTYKDKSGKRRRKTKKAGLRTRQAAEDWVSSTRKKLQGTSGDAQKRTLQDLADYYFSLSDFTSQRASSKRQISRWIRQFLKWADAHGYILAKDFRKDAAREYESYVESKWSRHGIESRIMYAGSIFLRDLDRDEPAVRLNPFKGLRKGKKPSKKLPVVISPELATQFFNVMTLREQAIFSIVYAGGLRVGELQNLRWEHVLNDAIMIVERPEEGRVGGWKPKTDESIPYVPMNDIMREGFEILRQFTGGQEYVLLGDRQANNKLIWQTWQRIFKRFLLANPNIAVPRGISPHRWRNTFITELLRAGEDMWKVQRVARHKSIRTTEGYAAVTYADFIPTVTKLPRIKIETFIETTHKGSNEIKPISRKKDRE